MNYRIKIGDEDSPITGIGLGAAQYDVVGGIAVIDGGDLDCIAHMDQWAVLGPEQEADEQEADARPAATHKRR